MKLRELLAVIVGDEKVNIYMVDDKGNDYEVFNDYAKYANMIIETTLNLDVLHTYIGNDSNGKTTGLNIAVIME